MRQYRKRKRSRLQLTNDQPNAAVVEVDVHQPNPPAPIQGINENISRPPRTTAGHMRAYNKRFLHFYI